MDRTVNYGCWRHAGEEILLNLAILLTLTFHTEALGRVGIDVDRYTDGQIERYTERGNYR